MKGKKAGGAVALKRGGAVGESKREEAKEAKREGRKSGGAVPGARASGGRLDKYARGGRMTPKEPFSGAEASNLSYASGSGPGLDEGGKGKDKK